MSGARRPGGPWGPNPSFFLGYNQVYDGSKYVILPVPSDQGATCVSGARFGPQEIISASKFLEPYDVELGFSPADAGIFTLPPLDPVQGDPARTAERVGQQVVEVYRSGKVPVMVGGDHSLTPGAVAALSAELGGELNLVVLDAHLDLYEEYGGSRFNHACSVRRAAEKSAEILLLGVRSGGLEERSFLEKSNKIGVIWSRDIKKSGANSLVEALESISSNPVYLSVDLDVMDPSAMPCVGCPEPGGLDWWETIKLLKGVFERTNVIAFDLMEFTPCGSFAASYSAAKLLYKMIALSELGEGGNQDL